MDKSLDELITSRPRGGRRGGARRGAGAKAQVLGTNRPKVPVVTGRPAAVSTQPSDKIIVSNLPLDVNEAAVKELFATTVGPLRSVMIHYDAGGRSKGIAVVNFQRSGDGNKAYQQYNNRLIDGKRPMKVEIVFDPSRPAAQSLVQRVAPAAAAAAPTNAPARGAAGGRGRAGRRGRGGRRTSERPPKSAADLDAEMEDYTQQASAPAAAA
ncbi:uncharacterized protein SCHCODRAFT_02640902 [Schizophyllum commune H4-8]|uniref:RRM domain-containing protein n=1 Tax=Schizophyllum commune (strain H4-8 / FGSC 9210) TaxID=578458 RepID=D8QHF3_SCHCM|nr:uncharacterized protein SCHCODRAFT_02640902 [Schizophyllum commune H4-8]KAI5887163.1 hypothetical protein SCHCODRAFT_02640902 [Schizophyllum commune H4-8]